MHRIVFVYFICCIVGRMKLSPYAHILNEYRASYSLITQRETERDRERQRERERERGGRGFKEKDRKE